MDAEPPTYYRYRVSLSYDGTTMRATVFSDKKLSEGSAVTLKKIPWVVVTAFPKKDQRLHQFDTLLVAPKPKPKKKTK